MECWHISLYNILCIIYVITFPNITLSTLKTLEVLGDCRGNVVFLARGERLVEMGYVSLTLREEV